MERLKLKQIDFPNLINNIEFDILICSSGYETRASFFAEKISSKAIKKKYVLSFNDQKKVTTRKKNDKVFESLKFTFIDSNKDQSEFIDFFMQQISRLDKNDKINVLIDYSSMTRTWFASFVNSFQYLPNNVVFYFSYSVAQYTSPIPYFSPSIKFEPIPGFNNLSIPDKPTALIIGLGYEKDRASGLIEYFDAEEVFLFHTNNGDYMNSIKNANKNLMLQVDRDKIIPYPIYDIEYVRTILTNLCSELSNNYRIIIAPCGPKPFSIISFIACMQLGYIDIWRISGENDPIKENRIPSGDIIIFSIEKDT